MANERAYTWGVVTYATQNEFDEAVTPLLQAAKHWTYCIHDKDLRTNDEGKLIPKEYHTHIIVTFENEKSWKQVKELVYSKSGQNTFAQPIRNKDKTGVDSVRGLWRYLIHDGEDETKKHLYDESERHCDDLEYWKKRVKNELEAFTHEDTFFEDLTAESFSVRDMGRKYGRDFMKNMGSYMVYRERVLQEQAVQRVRDDLEEIAQMCVDNGIDFEIVKRRTVADMKTYFMDTRKEERL